MWAVSRRDSRRTGEVRRSGFGRREYGARVMILYSKGCWMTSRRGDRGKHLTIVLLLVLFSWAGPGLTAEEPNTESESYLSQIWELDTSKPRGQHTVTPYRSNYFLPLTYNNRPNVEPIQEATGENVQETEAVFQLSLKIKLWQDVLSRNMDLWLGYTQRSFWQVYNTPDSSPFRETDYEPECLLNFRTDFPLLGMRVRMFTLGFNHQSNGRSEPLSRSWNRIVANVGLERGNFTLLVNAWSRIPESEEDDDNPDIEDYLGYGEIWGYYLWKQHRFGVMLRNNLQLDDNRGALQLEWSFPLVRRVCGYVQFFTGYGESLVDYNHSVNRIGIGFILRDWD
jgi:phospholipase A1